MPWGPGPDRVNRVSKRSVNGGDTDFPCHFHPFKDDSMSKLLTALCAIAFAATAYAQGTAPATPAAPAKAAAPATPAPSATPATPAAKSDAMKADTTKSAMADTGKTTVKKTTHKKKKAKSTMATEAAPAVKTDKAVK